MQVPPQFPLASRISLATLMTLALGGFAQPQVAIAQMQVSTGHVVPTAPVEPSIIAPVEPAVIVPQDPGVIIPILPAPVPPSRFPRQVPPSGRPLPPVIVNPTPSVRPPIRPLPPLFPPPSGGTTSFNYRVIVAAQTPDEQAQVRAIVPSAFQTLVNGQSVMQAGVFREQNKANELYQTLIGNRLRASILSVQPADITPNPSPPSPRPMPTRPIPNGRVMVVVDPGHGGGDPGAVGIGGLQEKEAVLAISRQVVSLLGQQGIQASLTRSGDQEIDLEPRVQFAEQANASVFVSIHANSISMSRPDINGLETYYYSGSNDGKQLAQIIHKAVLDGTSMQDRGVRTANFYVIKYTPMPAVLVEVGFVTGREDAARLADASGRTRLAQAIARGIVQYLRTNP